MEAGDAFDERLEKIIDKRVEERVQEELKRRGISRTESGGSGGDSETSRRQFLKWIGAAGVGAAMLPATSAFSVRSPDNFVFGSLAGGTNFDVNSTGDITAGSIDLGQGQVTNFAGNNLSIDADGNLNAATSSGGAPTDAQYLVNASDSTLSNEVVFPVSPGSPGDGQVLKYNESSGAWEPGTDQTVSGGSDLAELANGNVVYVSDAVGRQVIDPSGTATPVEDAIDAIHASNEGGAVFLPPTTIDHDGPINAASGVDIVGFGGNGRYASAINFTHDGKGIRVGNRSSFLSHTRFKGFMLRTNSQNYMSSPAPAISFEEGSSGADPASNVWDHIAIRWWYGPAMQMESGSNTFEQQFRHIRISLCDAGDSDALIDFSNGGAPNEWGVLAAYPSDTVSGNDSVIYRGGSNEKFGLVNIGGQAAEAFDTSGALTLGHMNWEPKEQNSTPDAIIKLSSYSPVHIGSWGSFSGDTNHVYQLEQGGTPGVDQTNNQHVGLGNKYLPVFFLQDYFGGSVSGNIVEIKDDITHKRFDDGPVVYEGYSDDVNNATGSTLSNPVTCLGDMTQVT